MPTKKAQPKHKYVDPSDCPPADAGWYRLFTCIMNVGGGERRPFYAEFVRTLRDPPGPMARHVMRVTLRSRSFRGGNDDDIVPYDIALGDYVTYAQEIVEDDLIEE